MSRLGQPGGGGAAGRVGEQGGRLGRAPLGGNAWQQGHALAPVHRGGTSASRSGVGRACCARRRLAGPRRRSRGRSGRSGRRSGSRCGGRRSGSRCGGSR
ncbi:hypothetical protein DWQ67_12805 [Galactobacter caseinivorans]|uniref:Uncharacterized protein n=1 Tax=Galactobacter caseinivorans TaxID=2676123 RepID=A0A496PFE4_9MICC|nr:hypothetical protein DWQ67_12805 [Galactobacter caseinivorans]